MSKKRRNGGLIVNIFAKAISKYEDLRLQFIKKHGKAFREKFRNKHDRKRLTKCDFTILSSNCIGGVISHDLGLRFLSPTVNLYIPPYHFVRFLQNLDCYLNEEITFIDYPLDYPVGMLRDIPIFFIHYHSAQEAREKWNERKKRINYDKLFIMMTDRYCCPYSTLEDFEKLPFKNKICFTSKKYPNLKSTFYLRKFKSKPCVGIITDIINIFGKRMYQLGGFDYVKWINEGENE